MQPPSWPSTSCVWPRRCFRRNLPSLRTWQGLLPRLSSQHHMRQTGRCRGALEARACLAAWNGSGMLAPERTRSPALGAGLSPGAAGKDKGAESGLRFCLWTWDELGALLDTQFSSEGGFYHWPSAELGETRSSAAQAQALGCPRALWGGLVGKICLWHMTLWVDSSRLGGEESKYLLADWPCLVMTLLACRY